MRRITGTHLYTYPKCPRAVELDFHGDPELRRAPDEVEAFVLKRGRDLEDRLVEQLDYAEPQYPERDFETGAQATLGLMREGVAGISQGVLLEDERLGIPDLLRRETGASALGDHHYVIGDIKSSRAARSDQILQIMFYSALLERAQGRAPAYAYLVLRDGHEERFALSDYDAVFRDVEQRIAALRSGEATERPFFGMECRSCRWSDVCLPELEAAHDLSLLQGMTRGLRVTLEAAGITDTAAAGSMAIEPTARRTRIENALLRRIKRSAEARTAGHPVRERCSPIEPAERAIVHLLTDPFVDRVHWFGVLYPIGPDAAIHDVVPAERADELPAFEQLMRRLPADVQLWHHGEALPRWYDEAAWQRRTRLDLEARMIDLARRLRGAAVYPAPVLGLADHVRFVLGHDPDRGGSANAVGLWMQGEGGPERVRAKGQADLRDLAALLGWVLEGANGPDT